MALDTLLSVLPSPLVPRDPGRPTDWLAVEQALGTALPRDYKSFVNTFGSGEIGSFLEVFNPFATNHHVHLLTQVDRIVDALSYDDLLPYPVHPEPGGTLPWGITRNGDLLCWLTEGDPDRWPVAIVNVRDTMYERYDDDMTTFVTKFVTGELVTEVFPNNVPKRDAPLFAAGR